jgi:hypothetical protein
MRFGTDSTNIDCPYCGEAFELVIDTGESEQHYIEDCYVCCRPIHLSVWLDDGVPTVVARDENDC